jgi:hypothetical protein
MIFTYTPTERLQLEAIDREELAAQQKLGQIFKQYEVGSEEAKAAKQDYQQGAAKREAALTSLLAAMDAAHFKTLGTPAAILADARQQVEDAIVYIYVRIWKYTPEKDKQKGKHFIVNLASGGLYVYPLGWDYEADFIQQKAAVFKPANSSILLDAAGTTSYIMREVLQRHIEALKDKPEGAQLQGIVDSIVQASPYTVDPAAAPAKAEIITADSAIFKANMPMYHGKATDALATLSSKDITANPIADKAVLQTEAGDYKIVIQDFSKIKGKLSVNTHKLLSAGIAEFTQINNYGGGAVNPKVTIPLNEYARLLGYEIDERPTDSPEAAAKEKKRAQEAVKTAKKRIRQDLELLQAMRWTWQEKVRGKGADFDSILLLERVAIRKGYIIMEFGRNMAEYLKQLPLTQYPQGLLAIDARSENAYRLGLKMAEHYSIDNNQIRGTANRLRVSTLLSVTGLPTMEMLQQEIPDDSRHWDRRIKEPFETALDRLTGKVISSWEYVKAKGEPLTDAEAYGITDYDTFTGLLVQFELLEAPDHEDRLARRAAEKKAAAAKKAAKEKRGRKRKV